MLTDRTAAKNWVKQAARDNSRIAGLTHTFYRYPARFSPRFARACIEAYSKPGDLILDPFMGGGTTIIEAMTSGRRSIGSDINELAAFIAQVKTSTLDDLDIEQLKFWSGHTVPSQRCSDFVDLESPEVRNMSLPQTRWLKKTVLILLDSIDSDISNPIAQDFARCSVLNTGQWALNGRKSVVTASKFRKRIVSTTSQMLAGLESLSDQLTTSKLKIFKPIIRVNDAELIDQDEIIKNIKPVDLVVTSPPYPGIHMLYHRWQVDGRKETDAPYWIANRKDGAGASHYNFADRRRPAEVDYYVKAARAFRSTRALMSKGGLLVQMVAFNEPSRQLPLYLSMLESAGFSELRSTNEKRIWRDVPGRRWHAAHKGQTSSSREVVLLHEAV